jgi:hypothetical protein
MRFQQMPGEIHAQLIVIIPTTASTEIVERVPLGIGGNTKLIW